MSFRKWLGALISGNSEDRDQQMAIISSSGDPLEEEAAGLNFCSAISTHQAWKMRLQAVIDHNSSEILSVDVVSKEDQCTLGKWILGSGLQQFGNDVLFQKLRKDHIHFHVCAGEVLTLEQQGQKTNAQESLKAGRFARASQEVIMDLAQLYSKASEAKSIRR